MLRRSLLRKLRRSDKAAVHFRRGQYTRAYTMHICMHSAFAVEAPRTLSCCIAQVATEFTSHLTPLGHNRVELSTNCH